MKVRLPALALLALVGAGLVVAPGADGTASAATTPQCNVKLGTRLAVDQPREQFPAVLMGNCADASVDYASWQVVDGRDGSSRPLTFVGTTRATLEFVSGTDVLGARTVTPELASDSEYCGSNVPQNTFGVVVKSQSRAGVGARRSGSVVTLNASAVYYNTGTHSWQPWKRARVELQQRSADGSWATVRTVAADDRGKATSTVRTQAPGTWRAVVQSTTRIWERTTPSVTA